MNHTSLPLDPLVTNYSASCPVGCLPVCLQPAFQSLVFVPPAATCLCGHFAAAESISCPFPSSRGCEQVPSEHPSLISLVQGLGFLSLPSAASKPLTHP